MLTFIIKSAMPSIKADLKYLVDNVKEFGIKGIPTDFEYMCDNLRMAYAYYKGEEI